MIFRSRPGFTLIELLIVIAIIAVLSVVVILALNPAELLRQSRDADRLSDLATINTTLNLYAEDVGGSMGNVSTVNVSLADTASGCTNLSLPTLPAIYTYHCSTSTTTRSVSSAGWIPLNFKNLSSGSPLGALPVDPSNSSSSRLYYTYSGSGSFFEVTAPMESQKYKLSGSNDVVSTDGGTKVSLHETGDSFSLEPLDYGDSSLIGYWTFDEGSGNIAYDYSGTNATGTWNGTQAGQGGTYYNPAKVGNSAGYFIPADQNYVNVSITPAAFQTGTFTLTAWIKDNGATSGFQTIAGIQYNYSILLDTSNVIDIYTGAGVTATTGSITDTGWHFVACIFQSGVTNGTTCYLDGGAPILTTTVTLGNQSYQFGIGTLVYQNGSAGSQWFNGSIDDVRLYNRALSPGELQTMYKSER